MLASIWGKTSMTSKKSETKFKEVVQKDLRLLGCWFFKTQERSRRGIPDIIACMRGVFIAIELKDEGKKLDTLQEYTLNNIALAGGIAIWTTPSMWPYHLDGLRALFLKKYDPAAH